VGYSYVFIKILYAKVTRIQFIRDGWGVDFSAGGVDLEAVLGESGVSFGSRSTMRKVSLEKNLISKG
jgi:hypothetical protein